MGVGGMLLHCLIGRGIMRSIQLCGGPPVRWEGGVADACLLLPEVRGGKVQRDRAAVVGQYVRGRVLLPTCYCLATASCPATALGEGRRCSCGGAICEGEGTAACLLLPRYCLMP